jgi:peroxiredoxin
MAVLTVTGIPNIFPKTGQPAGGMVAIGKPAPGFTGTTLDGHEITLSDLKGSIVAVSFWATWCVPCKTEMPELQTASQRYSAQHLKVLAVNAGEMANVVNSYVSAMKLTLPIILDPDKTIFNQYQVVVLPITVWIDTQGIVRAEQIGPLDQKMIASYMKLLTPKQ